MFRIVLHYGMPRQFSLSALFQGRLLENGSVQNQTNLLPSFGQPAVRKFLKKLSIMLTHTAEAARLEAAMVGSIGLEFSAAGNSKHGLPAFNALISAMSIRDACVSGGSRVLAFEVSNHVPAGGMPGLEIPTLRWALGMFDGVGHGRLEDACSRALGAQIRALLDRGAVPRANPVVACDTYYSPDGGRTELGYAAPGRLGAGANSGAGFMTSAAVSGPYVISTGFCRANRRAARAGCVARMLDDGKRSGLEPLYMALDKEYYSVGAMIECARRGRHFLMYAVENARVKEAVEAYKRGERGRVEEFTVGTGRRRFTGALVMAERARGRRGKIATDILPLFSNMPRGLLGRAAEGLPLEMERRRRRMEAGHRRIEAARPLTTSGRRSVRTYMFWRAMIMTNLWALVDFETKAALRAAEGKEFPPAAWSAEREPGDMDDTALPGGLDIKLEEFLSMYLAACTRAAIMDRKEQEGYADAAAAEFRHLFEPGAEGTGAPPEPPAPRRAAPPLQR